MSRTKKLLTLTITADFDKLIRDVMENQPEYSAGNVLQCYDYNYKGMRFYIRDTESTPADFNSAAEPIIPMKVVKKLELRFGDEHNVVTYLLTMPRLREGFRRMMDDVFAGELPGLELSAGNFMDAGHWDAVAADCLLQFSIFGGVIYG